MNEQDPFSDELLGQVLRTHRPFPSEAEQDAFWLELEGRLAEVEQVPPVSQSNIVWLRSPWFAAAAAFAVVLISFPVLQQFSARQSSQTAPATYEQADRQNRSLKEESVFAEPMKLGAAAPELEQEKQIEAKAKPQSVPRRVHQGQTAGLGHNKLNKTRYPIPAGLVHILQSYTVQLQSPAANVFDITLLESEHQAFEASLQQWAVSHQLEQRRVEAGFVYYRLTLRTN